MEQPGLKVQLFDGHYTRNLQSSSSILGEPRLQGYRKPDPPGIVALIRQVKANKERTWLVTAWFLRSKRERSNSERPPTSATGAPWPISAQLYSTVPDLAVDNEGQHCNAECWPEYYA